MKTDLIVRHQFNKNLDEKICRCLVDPGRNQSWTDSFDEED